MRLALFLAAISVCSLVYGFVGIVEGLRFRSPQTVTVEEFLKEKPQEGWFHITNAQLNVIESAFEENSTSHTIRKAFVPITSAEELASDKNEKTYLLMETTNAAIIDTMRNARDIKDEKAAIKFVIGDPQRSYPIRDVEGMIKVGLDSDAETRRELSKLDDSLASNYVILKEGKRPDLAYRIGLFIFGVALAGAQVLYYGRRFGRLLHYGRRFARR